MDGAVVLKAGKERPVQQHHPWVFSGAVASVQGRPQNGAAVSVRDARGEWLAAGLFSEQSQMRVRLLSWNPDQPIDASLFYSRIRRAVAGRVPLALGGSDARAVRLIFAESDGLPGLIVDSYAGFLVVQLLTFGMAQRAEVLVAALAELVQPNGIYERSDAEVRQKEGLPPREGHLWGQVVPERLLIAEYDAHFFADLRSGQKTGFFLDQRENRRKVASYCAGADLLDCFAYTGGFSVHAALAGARSITAIDTSAPALEALSAHLELNNCQVPYEPVLGDAFSILRRYRAEGRRWDVIVLDPPKFAQSQAQVERATRGYKDINLLAIQLLRPGGLLVTCSCSGLISPDLFQKVVFAAALDAGRDVQILERLSQAPDHPVLLTFPEAEYLKGLVCRVW